MVFTVTISLQINLTNPQCGLRHGLAGKFHAYHRSLKVFVGCIFLFAFGILYRFTDFGGPNHRRPAEDLAFAVARFIQKGGSLVNYYMVSLPTLPLHSMLKSH